MDTGGLVFNKTPAIPMSVAGIYRVLVSDCDTEKILLTLLTPGFARTDLL
jgi:hypothetical protein